MDKVKIIDELIEILLSEMPEQRGMLQRFPVKRQALRALMNVRPPAPLSGDFIKKQDELLSAERDERGIICLKELKPIRGSNIYLWQGDITRLATDAIVNAANSEMLGCFYPCHNCIDNIIHSSSGLQLRQECYQIIQKQGHDEEVGHAQITKGYNLPAKFVIHTVGPDLSLQGFVAPKDRQALTSCYRSCLVLADKNKLSSIAFCCISTGVFAYPPQEAALVAISTVESYLKNTSSPLKVVFNVFKDSDYRIYFHDLQGK
jgi:O-acetyl-ADP-ribose deacetylase (regulator of RNase III)